MKRSKKILMTVPLFLLWVLYFMLSIHKRNEYTQALRRGCHCIGSRDTGFFPGTERTYLFDPTRPPKRDYMTWREFWTGHGYYKNKLA